MGWVINGRMNKKLLYRTLRIYLVYSFATLLIVAPVFYYTTELLYLEDADDALKLRRTEFEQTYSPNFDEKEISKWNEYNRDIKIEENKSVTKDSLFHTFFYDTLSSENEPYRVLYSPIQINGKPYTFVAKINLVEQEDLLQHIAVLFLILAFLLLSGLYFITRRISKKLWKPFYDTLRQIEQFEIDKSLTPELGQTNIDEFNRLNKSISRLIKKNSIIYQSHREFIENAAHELQTPLAVFQGKIDNLMQRSDITETHFQELVSLNNSVSQLRRLNKNLLLLSKLENESYSDTEEITFNELLDKTLEFFSEQAKAKSITISIRQEGEFKVEANSTLTEVLLNNLIFNAIRHNVNDGVLQIVVEHDSITISNSGQVVPLDELKLFKRFSKGNTSKKGSGLGLAIVKRIAEINSWDIQYSFNQSLHTFRVSKTTF